MGGAKSDEFYVSTPPLEAKRLLFSEAATNRRFGKYEKKLLFVDVRKAYFNAKVGRPTSVELPPEMQWPGYGGRLLRCMYGTKSAAMRWEDTYTQALGRLGFAQGRASPCCFYPRIAGPPARCPWRRLHCTRLRRRPGFPSKGNSDRVRCEDTRTLRRREGR